MGKVIKATGTLCACFLFCLIYTHAIAQTAGTRYQVRDRQTQTALPFSSIKIMEAKKAVLTALSDREGYFYVDTNLLKNRNDLYISIDLLGYKGISQQFKPKPDSIFYLDLSAQALKEVAISAARNLISVSNTKITYDLAHDSSNSKNNVANAMRQLPGVDVSLNGDVKVGDKKILYMLNGQEDILVSGGKALNALPAHYISKIELITDPDPKYREQGYDLIINLVSKADIIEGDLGSAGADINSRGVPDGNVSFFHRKDSFSMNITASTRGDKSSLNEVTILQQPAAVQTLTSGSNYKSRSYNGSLELNYALNNTLVFLYTNYYKYNYNQDKQDTYLSGTGLQNIYTINNRQSEKFAIGAGARFNKLSKNTNGTIAASFSNSPSSSQVNNDIILPDSLNIATNNGTWKEVVFQGSFTTKYNTIISSDYGFQGIYRKYSSGNNTSFIHAGQEHVLSDETSAYGQDVTAAFYYIKLNPGKKLQVSVGTRAEYSDLNSFLNSANLFKKSYLNFLPRANLSYQTYKNQTLAISYTENLRRPSLDYISPFVNTSNPILNTTGNPNLKPEQFQNITLTYSFYLPHNFYLSPKLYYSFSNNTIQKIAQQVSNSFFYTYENGGKISNKLFFLGAGGAVSKVIQFNITGGIGQSSVALNNLSYSSIFYTLSATNTYTLPHGFTAQFASFFNSRTAQPQGYITGSNSYMVGMSKSFNNGQSSLLFSITNPLTKNRDTNSLINDNGFTITNRQLMPVRVFGLSYFYRFGKLKDKYVNRGSTTSTDDLKLN